MALPNSGVVVSVNLSERKGVRKTPVDRGTLVFDRGFEGDAHAGDWHRQVSLLGQESIDAMVAEGLEVGPGDFAENITTSGVDLPALPLGSLIEIGARAVLEVSQIGKVCHTKCAIYYQAGDCVMPREGIFAVVRTPGEIRVGDPIKVLSIGNGVCSRTPASAIAEFEAEKAAEAAREALLPAQLIRHHRLREKTGGSSRRAPGRPVQSETLTPGRTTGERTR
jgi:MOSC domain-containing protein YiiM